MSGVKRPSYRDRLGYHTLLLGGMACLAGAGLVLGNNTTKEEITLRKAEDLQQSLTQVIPAGLFDNSMPDDTVSIPTAPGKSVLVYRARKEGKIVGFAYEVVKPGYSGNITLIMGIDRNGKILGVRVVTHTETPGLGDKMETAKDDWIFDFNGLSLGNPPLEKWKVKKDGGQFDQWTGATITPRAIVAAIKGGLEMFQQHQAELLSESAPDTATPPAGEHHE